MKTLRKEKIMGNSFRSDRVAVEIQREINDILRNKVRDPRVQDVNITDVKVTGDLSQATVYYSLLSELASDNEKASAALKKATGLFKSELAKRMSIFRIPELTFEKDQSVEYGSKIDELLRGLNQSN
ncbi:ribosome-binding factor A [Lactococcus fujiensis JCM 16395]|uniref:Ribosome-binding factor A n=2 Tax=Lactococcus fujiensis TaxID=610251 RepID=A0A2A5RPU5_9LACT|nr:ribosome-binding factor A [Lactococcus fujiensis JCM 16395]